MQFNAWKCYIKHPGTWAGTLVEEFDSRHFLSLASSMKRHFDCFLQTVFDLSQASRVVVCAGFSLLFITSCHCMYRKLVN